MIEARQQQLRSLPMESREVTPQIDQDIYDILDAIEPPREAQRAIAKYEVQKALRFGFNQSQHIHCATDIRPGRTWAGNIRKVLFQKYGGTEGFADGDLDLESTMQGTDEIIYDA